MKHNSHPKCKMLILLWVLTKMKVRKCNIQVNLHRKFLKKNKIKKNQFWHQVKIIENRFQPIHQHKLKRLCSHQKYKFKMKKLQRKSKYRNKILKISARNSQQPRKMPIKLHPTISNKTKMKSPISKCALPRCWWPKIISICAVKSPVVS